MRDSVKFIFNTLAIKIPVFIVVSYAIFNLFAFSLTYFRLLGFSYVVMQTAVENNYLPEQEMNTLNAYLQSITNTGVVDSAFIVTTDNDPNTLYADATVKRQYGEPVTIGVSAHYRFIFPLMPRDQLKNEGDTFIGYGPSAGTSFNGFADDAELEQRMQEYEEGIDEHGNRNNNIVITYTVPGLKYYPDLS